MRRFILGKSNAVADSIESGFEAGKFTITEIGSNGTRAVVASSEAVTLAKDVCTITYGRASNEGGPIHIELCKSNFSFVKAVYAPSATFTCTFTVPEPDIIGSYGVMVAVKGKGFNERNKWTATTYVAKLGASATPTTIAAAIVKSVNANTVAHGMSASNEAGVITFTAKKAGVDYSIIGVDNLSNVIPSGITNGAPARCDAAAIIDMANKAAADAGFEYTYNDGLNELYPNYPLDPLKGDPAKDTGFTVYTLRFNEPRKVKTRDEVVNQIVQIAVPTGSACVNNFDRLFAALAK